KLLEAYYPECLAVCIVYNGPWWFSGVFKLISPLIDTAVAQKIQFAKNADGLSKFIDKNQILKIRGGNNTYEYTYVLPDPKENAMMADTDGKKAALEARNQAAQKLTQATKDWVAATKEADKFRSNVKHLQDKDSAETLSSDSATPDRTSSETRAKEAYNKEMALAHHRDECQEEFAQAARKLDFYTRARNIYNRLGVFDGQVADWSKIQNS
ncbi:CRAL-TRIO domain-containing protein, partial [Smittium mucronatum]